MNLKKLNKLCVLLINDVIIMENIKNQLLTAIKSSYHQHNETIVDDKLLHIVNSMSYGNDYSIRTLFGLQKYLKSHNIHKSVDQLFDDLKQTLDSDICNVTLEKNYMNINLTNNYIKQQIKNLLKTDNIIKQTPHKRKILVDFSSPNIAKDMHVGHLRSTIIGDSICRLYESQGHDVLRINHIGDFGLQFGMIIEHLLDKYPNYTQSQLSISDLQTFYAESKKRFDVDDDFKQKSYEKVVQLQSGNPYIVAAWNYIKEISRQSYNDIYKRLDIHLSEVGESFYQDKIPALIIELSEKKLLHKDEGRTIIKIPGHELPLTLIKSDGGYTYDTTDLAAIRYRLVDLGVDNIYYVVDNGQSLHFELIFQTAKMAGWIKENQIVKHVGFGLVLGSDKKKFKSRDGNTVKLVDLLDESLLKANKVLGDHRKDQCDVDKDSIIKSVAYGSIKYADLSTIRTNDYTFSFDKMLSLKGNTGAYQLYEYVRICGILKNAQKYIDNALSSIEDFKVDEKEEINVCKYLLQFPEIIDKMSDDLMLNTLCTYLYDLTNAFSQFHLKCRCLHYNENKEIVKVDLSRLLICIATKMIMGKCFDILGINKIEKM